MDNNSSKNKILYTVSLGLELGFLIALPLVLLLIFGLFLDRKLKTTPLFLIIFVISGFVITFFNVYYLILPFLEKRSNQKEKMKSQE